MKKIIILNGPNLNLLGEREKSQYGNFTLKDVEKTCEEFAVKNNLNVTFFQSNIEGELVEKIQESRNDQDEQLTWSLLYCPSPVYASSMICHAIGVNSLG